MSDQILADARNLKKLIREAEALADESMIAFARLRQAMLIARQNPAIEIDTGQRALLRLSQAEQQAMSMSTSLLRVHDELTKVARTVAVRDEDIPTEVQPSSIADPSQTQPVSEHA